MSITEIVKEADSYLKMHPVGFVPGANIALTLSVSSIWLLEDEDSAVVRYKAKLFSAPHGIAVIAPEEARATAEGLMTYIAPFCDEKGYSLINTHGIREEITISTGPLPFKDAMNEIGALLTHHKKLERLQFGIKSETTYTPVR